MTSTADRFSRDAFPAARPGTWTARESDAPELDERLDPELLRQLAVAARAIDAQESVQAKLELVSTLGVALIRNADEASITVQRPSGRFDSVASTGDLAGRGDDIQYRIGGGPCIDAVRGPEGQVVVDDLPEDLRWPRFARRVSALGARSVLSMRLPGGDSDANVRGLNLYSRRRAAFTPADQLAAELFTTHAGIALRAARSAEQVTNLTRAVDTNRDIGVAMGIIMARRLVPRDEAYDMLRRASQRTQRKLAEIAADVVETGAFDFTDEPARPTPRPHSR